MTWMQKFFQWLAMTDEEALQRAGRYSALMQTAMGVVVFLTGVFALFSGGYALYVTFDSFRVAAALAVPYALFIVFLDRLIVGATSRWTALPRIVLAIAIGLAVAVPVELRFFEDAIESRLTEEVTAYNQSLRDSLRASSRIPRLSARLKSIRKRRGQVLEVKQKADRRARCEKLGLDRPGCTGKKGTGPNYKDARARAENARQRAKSLTQRLDSLSRRQSQLKRRVRQRYEKTKKTAGGGLLTRYTALGRVKEDSRSARIMAWGIVALLVLLELAPTLLKTLRRKTPYERILARHQRARTNVELTKISTEANKKIHSKKRQDPQVQAGSPGSASPGQGAKSPPGGASPAKRTVSPNGQATQGGSQGGSGPTIVKP
jgi:hypothetical protein